MNGLIKIRVFLYTRVRSSAILNCHKSDHPIDFPRMNGAGKMSSIWLSIWCICAGGEFTEKGGQESKLEDFSPKALAVVQLD